MTSPSLVEYGSKYLISTSYITFAGGTPTPLVGAKPNRVALVFTDTGNSTFFDISANVGANQLLFQTTNTQQTINLRYEEVGSLVQSGWWGWRSAGSTTIGIIEVAYAPANPLGLRVAQSEASYKLQPSYQTIGSLAPTQMVNANPNRVALTMTSTPGLTAAGLNGDVSISKANWMLQNFGLNTILTWANLGPVLWGPIYGVSQVGSQLVGICEVLYSPTG